MINCKEDEIMEELFQSLSLRCQIGLETSMKGSDFISNCHNMLNKNVIEWNLKRLGSYIGSPGYETKKHQ